MFSWGSLRGSAEPQKGEGRRRTSPKSISVLHTPRRPAKSPIHQQQSNFLEFITKAIGKTHPRSWHESTPTCLIVGSIVVPRYTGHRQRAIISINDRLLFGSLSDGHGNHKERPMFTPCCQSTHGRTTLRPLCLYVKRETVDLTHVPHALWRNIQCY
ncbi:hypothetical protein CEXT_509971 [Caerostris extrusa]|uniref:Uncharacterized protein n=1 Tax=Caerostris extrusa TaxID=172846 RepID=A0AAV4N3B5_CAEEX|nr:hypothetical protein CEXT_509971 [Caerostris extrusa]